MNTERCIVYSDRKVVAKEDRCILQSAGCYDGKQELEVGHMMKGLFRDAKKFGLCYSY